jgi:hypothetical protein
MTHTPLPWHRSTSSQFIRKLDGDWPAWNICEMNKSNPRWKDDAAFIDRAVDCHDDLVAALEATVTNGHYNECLAGQRGHGQCSQVCHKVRAALAKAKKP